MSRGGTRSRGQDWRLVGFYSGRIVVGFGLLMLIPALVAIGEADWSSMLTFIFSASVTVASGFAMSISAGQPQRPAQWYHGLLIASVAWVLATLFGAIPYDLSGYYLSYLDAAFDVMSGLTTTGLSLIQHPDAISDAMNTYRFIVTYVGGLGIVVMALTFFVNEGGAFKLYVGEAKDERILPNVRSTARAIWRIGLLYLVVGSALLFVTLVIGGFPIARAPWNAVWMFLSAFSTGGFAPHSQNLLYYHNPIFEFAVVSIAIIGSLNFAFHYALWQGRWKEATRDLEFLTFFLSVNIMWLFVAIGLIRVGAYSGIAEIIRIGYLNLISAHTTTGVSNIYAPQFPVRWGSLAMLGMVMAMLIGGSATSTAGGFKGIRGGILLRAIAEDVRRMLLPERAVVRSRFHHIEDSVLTDARVRGAAVIIMLYLATFATVALILALYGYPLTSSLFEAASVTGNVGLSSGITQASMAPVLKLLFMVAMWVGRLEFMSVFALVASLIRGRVPA